MPFSEEMITSFLQRYGEALSAGDVPTIVSSWQIPAFVLSDQEAHAVTEAAQVEQFFTEAVASYRAQGLVSTIPELLQVEPLGQQIASVDVRWSVRDPAGVPKATEHIRYILRLLEDGSLRVQVSLSLSI
ncbi:MAG: hypothetical protein GX552_17040 [Chloroflexi bacterium]|jgi:hypothetical protein|nr:hypothetical protein [Chloroflexota bacterium]